MAICRARRWPNGRRECGIRKAECGILRFIPHAAFCIPHSHLGFTLLELLAVMTLLALIAALSATKFSTSYRSAQLTTVIAAVQALDQQMRTLATKYAQPYELRIDLEHHLLSVTPAGDLEKTALRIYTLPSPLQIAAVRSPREDRSYGEAVIRCDSGGRCETYAIKLTTSSAPSRWLLFTGVTGQLLEEVTDRQIEELFRALRPTGSDAD